GISESGLMFPALSKASVKHCCQAVGLIASNSVSTRPCWISHASRLALAASRALLRTGSEDFASRTRARTISSVATWNSFRQINNESYASTTRKETLEDV